VAKSTKNSNSIVFEYDDPLISNKKFYIDITPKLKPGLSEEELSAIADAVMNQVKIISRYRKVLKALELDNEELQV